MKNKYILIFISFYNLFPSAKAQDTIAFNDFRIGYGMTNAGLNLSNTIAGIHRIYDFSSITTSKSFIGSYGLKKGVIELGIDHSKLFNGNGAFEFRTNLINLRNSYQWRVVSNKTNDFNLFTDIGLQYLKIQMDSINPKSNLLSFTSTSFKKSSFTVGPGLEYLVKGKIKNHISTIFGVRLSYNFYLNEKNNRWKKSATFKSSEFHEKDIGYFQGQIFVGWRFYKHP